MLATPEDMALLRKAVQVYFETGEITDSEADHLDRVIDRLGE